MACIEEQIFEAMALIYKEVVNAHQLKVHHVILTLLQGRRQLSSFYLQVLLSFLQSRSMARETSTLVAEAPQGFLLPSLTLFEG